MKALIVDDERLARQELKQLLSELPDIEITGESANADEALESLRKQPVDVLFLDIEMPEKNGFDLLAELPLPHPRIVFVTAYDDFALRAFEKNALDYLLKPVSPARLRETWQRISHGLPAPLSKENESPFEESDQVFIRDEQRSWFVPITRIRYLEGTDNHTQVHFDNEKPMLYRTLVSLEARLPESLFIRANRSQLVNRRYIEKLEPWFSGCLKATLTDGTEIEFSRRQSQILRTRLAL